MRRFWTWTAAVALVTAVAMAATLAVPFFGVALWHANLGIAAVCVAGGLAWQALRPRRVATLTMAVTGTLATVTGFVMLLTIQFPWKEWITWWHVVTSVAFAFAFLVHWTNNHPRLLDLTRKLFDPPAPGILAGVAWAGLFALGAWTATPAVRGWFTGDNYLNVSWWTIVVGIVGAYGLWWAFRLPGLRRRLSTTATRNRARGLVDSGLFLANWAALLTGFALLYLADPLRSGPLKYVSKWWHTATSVFLLALLALHVGFNARVLVRHAKKVDDDLRRQT